MTFTQALNSPGPSLMKNCLFSTSDGLTTSIHYKLTDTHSYLNYASSHPIRCKNSIPHSQFLRLRRICTDNEDFDVKSKEMANFFRNHGYPQNIVDRARTRILARPRVAVITSEPAADIPPAEHSTIALVLTYHPTNQLIKNIISRNFYLLRDDPDTAAIFPPLRILYAYLRDQNLRDYLVRSTLTNPTPDDEDRGTFPCGRSRCTATPASTSTIHIYRYSKVDASLLHRNTPVSARTWFIPSNARHVTRSISKKLADAWVADLGNIYAPQGYQTPIFLLDDILLPRGTPLRTCWSL